MHSAAQAILLPLEPMKSPAAAICAHLPLPKRARRAAALIAPLSYTAGCYFSHISCKVSIYERLQGSDDCYQHEIDVNNMGISISELSIIDGGETGSSGTW